MGSKSDLPVMQDAIDTVALNGAKNAGILAAQIIGSSDTCVLDKVIAYKEGLKIKVNESAKDL